jgi:ribosomal protein S7
MPRYRIIKKHKIFPDSTYNSVLITLLIAKILKRGKKKLANSIILETFTIIKKKNR